MGRFEEGAMDGFTQGLAKRASDLSTWYHYIPKSAEKSVRHDGLVSPGRGGRARKGAAVEKYRHRFGTTHVTDTMKKLEGLRGERPLDYIYLHKEPIPRGKSKAWDNYLRGTKLVRVTLPKEGIEDVYAYTGKAGGKTQSLKRVFGSFTQKDMKPPKKGQLMFENVPHIGVRTKSGKIGKKYVEFL